MPSPETNPKPSDKPTEKDVQNTKGEEKNVDRDGRERHPTQHAEQK